MTVGGRLLATALVALIFAGCTTQRAPVVNRSAPRTPAEVSNVPQVHVVARGDTLYAIAWRYQTTVEKLAQLNRLGPPYLLHIGDRLLLGPARPQAPVAAVAPTPDRPGVKPPTGGTATAVNAVVESPASGAWLWPATGNVTRQYDSNGQFKGINIQSRSGTPIQAAAAGEVVYAGDGLRGYGQLIIVKHSEVYLSAYAYNRVMAVREGDKVTAGQRLGEVGGDAANPGRFYFEIRKQGDPIDPTRLLPSQ